MILSRRTFLGGASATLWIAPPLGSAAAPAPADNDFRDLTAGPASAQIAGPPARPTSALGYQGATPGPLLRFRHGETVKVRLVNKTDEPTTLHWHGMRIANSMAGIGDLTQPPVLPGASFDYRFVPPDAGFASYRPHAGASSAGQVGRGLYGPIIVEEAAPPPVDLDAVVAVQDWALDGEGQYAATATGEGRIGKVLAANGAPAPLSLSPRPGARVRLRLVNAAVARVMIIAIEGLKPTIIAIDGQPSEPFEPLRNSFPMGPGARFELMFDMPQEAGAEVRFILRGGEASPIASEPDRPLVLFRTAGAPIPARPPFAGLKANPLLPTEIALDRSRRIDIAITGAGASLAFNAAALTAPWPAKPLFSVSRGSPVTLGLNNKTNAIQIIRWTGHVARQLHPLDDGWEPYWRDSAFIAPGQTVHVAFVADNPGRWPIESADLDRQAAGGRTYFEVI
jgi:FtsP/CotA-like multicopper oxidase with cupredoxin domain